MVELTTALVFFLFPLAYSPGPGNLFFAANGARFGLRSTIPATTGYHIATWIVTVAIGFGFTAVLHEFPSLFIIIKVLGSLYVLWLAWKLLRSGIIDSSQEPTVASFKDGVVLLVLNPKAYFIIAAMFAQFISNDLGNKLVLVLWISTIFTFNNLLAFTLWTIVGDRLAILFRNESNARLMNIGFGSLLAAVAIWMFFS
ncbi:MAG: LysE family translocator [Allomuricauda sp.]